MGGENHGLSLVTLLIAAVAIGGYFFDETAPSSNRPVAEERLEHNNAHSQDVPTRLWQDPFEAVNATLRAEKHTPRQPDSAARSGLSRFDTLIADISNKQAACEALLILPVTVSGSNQPETQESRRRIRYAVVSALIQAGYEPEQPGHIGYAADPQRAPSEWPADLGYVLDPTAGNHQAPTGTHPSDKRQHIYPYEWFDKRSNSSSARAVLVVWVNSDLLGDNPIATMASWQSYLPTTEITNIPIRVIGTFGSGTLLNLARELNQWFVDDDPPQQITDGIKGLTILSPTATIAEAMLPGGSGGPWSLEDSWQTILPESQFLRITNTDAALMEAMVKELRGRGIDPNCDSSSIWCSHIALISESDTLYGRSLPRAFIDASGAKAKASIHRFSYLRGLDGRIPNTRGARQARPNESRQALSGSQASFGEARIDYLERLADRIQRHDHQLQLNLKGRLRAIGVLGSDVYDKLLILQALKQRFPGMVFFTTDLDSRLLDQNNLAWTRNLVVVSDFGLQLRDEIQGHTPPFRSSYQTSTYLATLLALRDSANGFPDYTDLQPALQVRLFEIGRDKAYALTAAEPPPDTLKNIAGLTTSKKHPLRLHPDNKIGRYTSYHCFRWFLIALATFISALIALLMVNRVQRAVAWLQAFLAKHKAHRMKYYVLLSAYFLVAVFSWVFSDWLGEPYTWSGGVSAWPAEYIRLFAGLLALALLWRTLQSFQTTNNYINEQYFTLAEPDPKSDKVLGEPPPEIAPAHAISQRRSLWQRLRRWLSFKHHLRRLRWQQQLGSSSIWLLFCFSQNRHNGERPTEVKAKQQWELYLLRNQPGIRWFRVIVPAALFLLVTEIVIHALNGPPPVPVRTFQMLLLDKFIITVMTVIPSLLLLFTVMDSCRSSIALMDGINRPQTTWPETTKGLRYNKIHRDNFNGKDLDEWLDVQLSADLTHRLGDSVYYPFVIIVLILLSRLSWFDNWTLPSGLLVIVALSAFYATYCSVNLQFAARRVREHALRDLRERRLQEQSRRPEDRGADALSPEVRIEQIDSLIKDVTKLKRGAFRKWHQQPIIKAFLLLLSSASIFAIDMLGGG